MESLILRNQSIIALKTVGLLCTPHWHVRISKSTMIYYKYEVFYWTNVSRYLLKAFGKI